MDMGMDIFEQIPDSLLELEMMVAGVDEDHKKTLYKRFIKYFKNLPRKLEVVRGENTFTFSVDDAVCFNGVGTTNLRVGIEFFWHNTESDKVTLSEADFNSISAELSQRFQGFEALYKADKKAIINGDYSLSNLESVGIKEIGMPEEIPM